MSKFTKLSYGQQGEDLVLQRILFRTLKADKTKPGFYLDIGAYHPEKDSITKFLYDLGWAGICVDMNIKSIELFKKERPNDIAIHCAVSDCEGEITGYFDPGEISVTNSCSVEVANKKKKQGMHVDEILIPCKTANSLMSTYAPNVECIDFLNIDVEGFELQALRGLDFKRYKPKVVALEIHAKNINQALTSDVAGYMYYLGYVPVASCVITYFFIKK